MALASFGHTSLSLHFQLIVNHGINYKFCHIDGHTKQLGNIGDREPFRFGNQLQGLTT